MLATVELFSLFLKLRRDMTVLFTIMPLVPKTMPSTKWVLNNYLLIKWMSQTNKSG